MTRFYFCVSAMFSVHVNMVKIKCLEMDRGAGTRSGRMRLSPDSYVESTLYFPPHGLVLP